jgi:predicted phosphodiesterase
MIEVMLSKNIEYIRDRTNWEDAYNSYEVMYRVGVSEIYYVDGNEDIFDSYSMIVDDDTEQATELRTLILNMENGEYENKSKILSVLR